MSQTAENIPSKLATRNINVLVHRSQWDSEQQKYTLFMGWPNANKDHFAELERLRNRKSKACVNVSLYTALTNRSACAAYLVQYAPTKLNVRLNTGIFASEAWSIVKDYGHDAIEMHLAIFDVDAHKTADVEAWWLEQQPKLRALLAQHPDLFVYRSQGGMRIIGALPTPFRMSSHQHAEEWRSLYDGWCNYLHRNFELKSEGKETGDKLNDWSRYQRVPHDTRVQGQAPAEFPVIGDPEWIGFWDPQLSEADKVPVRQARGTTENGAAASTAIPWLHTAYWLVRAAGLRCDATTTEGKYNCQCPNHEKHTSIENDEKNAACVLYLNADGSARIHCKHDSCSSLYLPDLFSDALKAQVQSQQRAAFEMLEHISQLHHAVDLPSDAFIDWSEVPETAASRAFIEMLERYRAGDYSLPENDNDSEPDSDIPPFEEAFTASLRPKPKSNTGSIPKADLRRLLEEHRNEKKKLYLSSITLALALQILDTTVAYNDLTRDIELKGLEAYGFIKLTDIAVDWIDIYMRETLYMTTNGTDNLRKYIRQQAWEQRYHPIRQYLSGLSWDKEPRLDTWLIRHAGAKDDAYTRAVSGLPLMAAARRIFEPGAKFDELLILCGPQGQNKSSGIKTLLPEASWFSDDLPLGADSRTVIERTKGKWLIEAAELRGFSKADVAQLKSFMSRTCDSAREAYARDLSEVYRQFVLIGTENGDDFLGRDDTGDRRSWPISITRAFDLQALAAERDQIWAEAHYRANIQHESIRLDSSLYTEAETNRADFSVKNPLEDKLAVALYGITGIVANSCLWDILGVPMTQRGGNGKLKKAMTAIGWTDKMRKLGGKPVRSWASSEKETLWMKAARMPDGSWDFVNLAKADAEPKPHVRAVPDPPQRQKTGNSEEDLPF